LCTFSSELGQLANQEYVTLPQIFMYEYNTDQHYRSSSIESECAWLTSSFWQSLVTATSSHADCDAPLQCGHRGKPYSHGSTI